MTEPPDFAAPDFAAMVKGNQRDAPAVSVLIKAYNHAPYIRRTIESVLDQSFQDFEIVVTDDCSTDETLTILNGYTDPRIRLEAFTVNQGISGAMNATIARARGRYLAILNSDDWALPGRLRRQVDFLDRHPAVSLVFGLPRIVDEAGERTAAFNDFTRPLRLPDFSRGTWLRQFFFDGNCLCAPTAMIRREAYAAAGDYDRRLTNLQDLDMWIRMLLAGHDIHVLPDELTAMRIRDNHANMSAPRPDTRLRSKFEAGKVLRHFASFDTALFNEVFGDGTRSHSHRPPAQRVAELALLNPGLEYQHFALETFYESARDTDGFNRLRALAGNVDVLGSRTIQELCQSLLSQGEMISRLTEAASARDRHLGEIEAENARAVARLIVERNEAAAGIEALRRDLAVARMSPRGMK